MSKTSPTIVTTKFKMSVVEIYNYIYEDSYQNAESFAEAVNEALISIQKMPTAHPLEPRLPTKRNFYRFKPVKKNFKIIFKVLKSKTIFLGVIHAARSQKEYQQFRTTDYS